MIFKHKNSSGVETQPPMPAVAMGGDAVEVPNLGSQAMGVGKGSKSFSLTKQCYPGK